MKAWAKRDHRRRYGFRSLQDRLSGLGASVRLALYAFALCEIDIAASWCDLEVNNGADDSSCTIVSLRRCRGAERKHVRRRCNNIYSASTPKGRTGPHVQDFAPRYSCKKPRVSARSFVFRNAWDNPCAIDRLSTV
ncbi:hypothetical protein IG631_23540 [Alternaria alternata]|nr:hypothetical protein IG631_23540 [Alternaria alternata]